MDLRKAITEWRRVLAPGAILILADTCSPEDSPTSIWMNDVEERRDPSHVSNLSPSGWLQVLEENGLHPTDSTLTDVPHDFDDWVRRSGTPSDEVENLRRDFLNAPQGSGRGIRHPQGRSRRHQLQVELRGGQGRPRG